MFGRDEYFNVTTSCMYIWIGWQFFLSSLSPQRAGTTTAATVSIVVSFATPFTITGCPSTERRSRENFLPLCGYSEWNIPRPSIQTIGLLVRRRRRRRGRGRRRRRSGRKEIEIRTQTLHQPRLFQCHCQIQCHVVKLCEIGKGRGT